MSVHSDTPAAPLPTDSDPADAFRHDHSTTAIQPKHAKGTLPKRDFIFHPHVYASRPIPQPEMDAQNKALSRVQVATPLSVLITLASFLVTALVVKPGMNEISMRHVNYLTPSANFLLSYWALLFLLLVGYCILIVVSRKQETKKLILSGVGIRLALVNFGLALWAIFWVLDQHWSFIAGEAVLAFNAVLLIVTVGILTFKFGPNFKHPLDWLFVHVPVKMLLVVILQVDLWQQLGIILGWDLRTDHVHGSNGGKGLWPAFGLITGVGGVLPSLWIFGTADITYALAGIYLHLAILFRGSDNGHPNLTHRRPEIIAAVILAMVMQAVALFSGIAWSRLQKRQEGQIALPISEEEGRRAYEQQHGAEASASASGSGSGSRSGGKAIQAGSSSRGTVGMGITDLESVSPGVEEEQNEAYRDEPRVTRTLGSQSS
ncbi:unnamed protein product [Tilletia controversa]|uniref:Uncharacterized protein n=1 Tax=Tilletia controversa TaxID=13291 RepID=A0A8X7MX98_9BASI|nr:hypothetical protein CF328_g5359 [Tilletia controversa]KAE8253175.1 hypothetical protein A4X06_0g1646 [Tilletia controversa]CAD6905280.1 unnamed protein product [Tilletia controversa]CAD6933343.1 unnamed protein product [Tilletia controversa]CAD6933353.1 unnamed protein product [Tilletia controversa]